MTSTSLIPQELDEQLDRWFAELPLGHSDYQIEQFIVGQYLTPDRKYRQCLHELYVRYNSLKELEFDCREIHLRIQIYKQKISNLGPSELDALRIQGYENKVDRANHQLRQLLKRAQGLRREMECFIKMAEKEKARKRYASFEEAEEEYWMLKRKLESEALSGTPSVESS